MVTEMFLGWTLSSTHCLGSEAKRWGSLARSQRSFREQLAREEEEEKGERDEYQEGGRGVILIGRSQ